MLGLRRPPAASGPLPELANESVVEVSYDELCHLLSLIATGSAPVKPGSTRQRLAGSLLQMKANKMVTLNQSQPKG